METTNKKVLNDRYAESIIGDRHEAYDALEIQGVRDLNGNNDGEGTCCEVDNEKSEFFSVYAHLKEGGVDCIGDFCTHGLANAYAKEVASQYGWLISDYVQEEFKVARKGNYQFKLDLTNENYEIKVDVQSGYGYFEHHKLGDQRGGGLWFEGLDLTDYDGVTELPKNVATALRSAGFSVDEDFADIEPSREVARA